MAFSVFFRAPAAGRLPAAIPVRPIAHVAATSYALFLALVFAFVWTRAHTVENLGLATLPETSMRLRALLTGALSDVWISALGALLLTLALSPLAFGRRAHSFLPACGVLVSLAVGALVSAHIPYVEFFGTLFSWRHTRYLVDADFVRASADGLLQARVAWGGVGAAVAFLAAWGASRPLVTGRRAATFAPFLRAAPLALLALGGACQVAKVQANTMRWGWRVPPALRYNVVENALVQWWRSAELPPVTSADARALSATGTGSAALKARLEEGARGATSATGEALRAIVRHRLMTGRPLFVFLVLLESFRPEESATYEPALARVPPGSGTPRFDALAREGVVFTNAYTAGGVTRAGQEAVLCGLLSGELSSAMRENPGSRVKCLPRRLKDVLGEERVHAAWWHGGDFNFDSQGTFWKRQGMDFVLSREDFLRESGADAVPSTFWGVSDFTLVERLRAGLFAAPPAARVQLHTLLSVTNHPSWVLPGDAPIALLGSDAALADTVKPLVTTRYTDEALGRLAEHLKSAPCFVCDEGSIWDNALVFVANDHGTLMPSLAHPEGYGWDRSPEDDIAAARAASRAALLVTGGMVRSAVVGQGRALPEVDSVLRSQIDVYATLTDLFGLDEAPTVGDSLFAATRRNPVVVDLGNRVFLPGATAGTGAVHGRDSFLSPSFAPAGAEEARTRAFFLAVQALHSEGLSGF